jgi:hypothetical protein
MNADFLENTGQERRKNLPGLFKAARPAQDRDLSQQEARP